jgi:hypothetical protein
MHDCAAPGCRKSVKSDQLMCKRHWYKVPKDLRDEVWATWRNVKRDRESYHDARDRAIKSLLKKDGADPQREFSLL